MFSETLTDFHPFSGGKVENHLYRIWQETSAFRCYALRYIDIQIKDVTSLQTPECVKYSQKFGAM